MTDEQLEREDEWAWNDSVAKPAVKRPRAVVSVAFNRYDFERLDQYAERHGIKLSELIRQGALLRIGEGASVDVVDNLVEGRSIMSAGLPIPRTAVSGGTIAPSDQQFSDVTTAA
jgi:hypothetical protein